VAKVKRPQGVTFVALFQFSKAAFLLLLTATISVHPEALSDANSIVRLLISIATSHVVHTTAHLHGDLVAFRFAVYAVPGLIFGCGLWFMKKWARTILVWSSGIWVVRWVLAAFVRDWAFGDNEVLPDKQLWAFMVIDLAIFSYLVHDDVKRAFDGAGT